MSKWYYRFLLYSRPISSSWLRDCFRFTGGYPILTYLAATNFGGFVYYKQIFPQLCGGTTTNDQLPFKYLTF
jgi:hypothetical protein